MSAILEKLIELRNQIDNKNRRALLSLSREYAKALFRLQGDLDSLQNDLLKLKNPSPRQIANLPSYQRLIVRLEEEISGYSFWLKGQLEEQSQENILFGSLSAKILLGVALAMRAGIAPDFQKLVGEELGLVLESVDPAITSQLLSQYTDPLLTKVGQMSTHTIAVITNAINGGASALRISSLLGLPLADAIRFTRTVQGWSFREALRTDYVANGIEKWMWISALDIASCLSCISQHGNIYPISESLNDHDSGWCIPLPVVEGVDYEIQTGNDWWNEQSEATKRQMAGDLKYDSMLDGTTTLNDYSVEVENDIYGKIRIESSQKNLVGG